MKANWKVLKHAIKQPCKSNNIEKIQYMGNEITDTKMIAEECNEHFVPIGNKRDSKMRVLVQTTTFTTFVARQSSR